MKAIVCTKYGPPEVLKLAEVKKPVPKNNQILLKIYATSVTASDCIVRGFKLPTWSMMGVMMKLMFGFRKPRNPILGMVAAGEVEAVGKNVTRFSPGDQVFTFNIRKRGTYAEYICLPENEIIVKKPANLSFEEAAAIPYGGAIALHYLKLANLQPGQNVLIFGASGANGSSAVQLAKHFGAQVTGVCSTKNLEWVQALGADRVIDYTKEDFTERGEAYDFIFDAVGKNKSAGTPFHKVLAPGGKFLSVDDGAPKITLANLSTLKDLVEAGKLKPVLDRVYPLEQMAEAHAYVDKGHKKGNVIVSIAQFS